MGIELIMGMEEVINYLKQLEAENKKLKEDLEKAWDQRGDKWRKSRINKLQEENKKLKEENTQYRMDICDLKDDLHLYKASHTTIVEENKKLKEELQWHYDTRGDIVKKLKETIDKLKE